MLSGAPWFDAVFAQLDPKVRIVWRKHDGDPLAPDDEVCRLQGPARALLTGARYPGIATHDDQLIEATKALVAQEGIAPDRFEFQMLYGLRDETQCDLVRQGYRMRTYVPYGTEWVPYFSRRLRERKENVFFVLKAMVKG